MSQKKFISKAQLEDLYLKQCLSTRQIAKYLNMSQTTVRVYLHQHQIKPKTRKIVDGLTASQRYYQRHRDRCIERCRKWRAKTGLEYRRAYRKKHHQRDFLRAKQWKKANPDKMAIYSKRAWATNKEKLKQRLAEWKEKFPWKNIFKGIKRRCENPDFKNYKYYGGRGIKCLITMEEVRLLYLKWEAAKIVRPEIHRLDSNGHYSLENCIFVPKKIHKKLENLSKEEQIKIVRTYLTEI